MNSRGSGSDLVGRLSGPLTLRVVMQPLMATLFALRDGMKDAHAGRPPYLWTVFSDHEERRQLIADGWKAIGKVFVIAIVLDVIYELIVFRMIRPLEVLIVAIVLAALPYALLRGPVNRAARLWRPQ